MALKKAEQHHTMRACCKKHIIMRIILIADGGGCARPTPLSLLLSFLSPSKGMRGSNSDDIYEDRSPDPHEPPRSKKNTAANIRQKEISQQQKSESSELQAVCSQQARRS